MIAFLIESGVHYDGTITLGNIISAFSFSCLATIAWTDLRWRIRNLEAWRLEHMVDADSRDKLLRNSDMMIAQLKTLVESDRKRHH